MTPILYFVIPCYNEEQVLPETSGLFLAKLNSMIDSGKISPESRIMFVNDGSKDGTWNIISSLTEEEKSILTDACKIFTIKNKPVYMVEGEVFNIKITYPYDMKVAATLLKGKDSDD